MDFEIIEGLTDEEIMEFYESDVLNGDDKLSECCCCYSAHCYCFGGGYAGIGYCDLRIIYHSACRSHCSSKGMGLFGDGTFGDLAPDRCNCAKYGIYGGEYGYWSRCR